MSPLEVIHLIMWISPQLKAPVSSGLLVRARTLFVGDKLDVRDDLHTYLQFGFSQSMLGEVSSPREFMSDRLKSSQ